MQSYSIGIVLNRARTVYHLDTNPIFAQSFNLFAGFNKYKFPNIILKNILANIFPNNLLNIIKEHYNNNYFAL